ncbi:methylenetetrahydrofolate reductase [NAD(P)H] [Myxococcota bacterium]|nr:methylenetetrahydrofolate reductase [NAD(P)H] [Myxococcota bacterium]
MRVGELYDRGQPVFSFEFFPPKTDRGFSNLYRTIGELKQLAPDFVSVTWGAGGSTRSKTVDMVIQIQDELEITAMAHLSCIGSTPAQLEETLSRLGAGGIENILALGGDRPDDYVPPQGAFNYANELVDFISTSHDFCLGGACYPEVHPAAPSAEVDLENLIRKVDAGVDFLITQLFFDNAYFFEFEKRARAAGIEVPIIPGIMPIISASNIRRITALCEARIPDELESRLSEVEHEDALTTEVGVEWATLQCRELLENGVPGIHFYTMNKSPATRHVFRNLQP